MPVLSLSGLIVNHRKRYVAIFILIIYLAMETRHFLKIVPKIDCNIMSPLSFSVPTAGHYAGGLVRTDSDSASVWDKYLS